MGGRHGVRHDRGLQRIDPATRRTSAGSLGLDPRYRAEGYIALTAFVVNIIVAAVLTLVMRAVKAPDGVDSTIRGDYFADAGDPRVAPLPPTPTEATPARDG